MSIVGPIMVPIYGAPDETGERVLAGWAPGVHYNISRTAMTEGLEPYAIEPTAPAVVWSADARTAPDGPWRDTAFLRFADETEAQAVLMAEGLMLLAAPEPEPEPEPEGEPG